MNQVQTEEFKKLFSGSQHSYGQYTYSKEKKKDKLQGEAYSVKDKLVTIKEYKDHLEGKKGLGIIPITETNKCRFAVIDVDIYNVDLSLYVEAIERGGFPLVPFRSKSGGLHIYIFLKEEVKAKNVIDIMRKFSFILSIEALIRDKKKESVEIFPKQVKLRKGDMGNWINLPYYNSKQSQQYAIKEGTPLSLDDAIRHIKDQQVTLSEAQEFLKELLYKDAPPCLQMLYFLNPFGEGGSGRNNFLFSFGVYLKKLDEDFFEHNLQEVNQSLRNPLPEKEVDKTILQSLRKKDYMYLCNESPCVDYCHKKECKKREYGIGKNEGYFSSVECGQLFQYKTAQPYYEWEVRLQGTDNFKRLRFKTEDEVIKQDAFLRLCMRELHELPSKLKQAEWFNKVNQALKEISCIDVDESEDTSPIIILKNLVLDFATGRAMAETKDQILAKRAYFDVPSNTYWFRVKDLIEYLYVQKNFKFFQPQEIHGILRGMGCSSKTVKSETRQQIRVMCIVKDTINVTDDKDLFKPDFSEYTDENF